MLNIRRSRDRLIFNMGIPILLRRYPYIETGPWIQHIQETMDIQNDSWPPVSDYLYPVNQFQFTNRGYTYLYFDAEWHMQFYPANEEAQIHK